MIIEARTHHELEQLDTQPTVIGHKLHRQQPSEDQREPFPRIMGLAKHSAVCLGFLVLLLVLRGALVDRRLGLDVADCFVTILSIIKRKRRIIIEIASKALTFIVLVFYLTHLLIPVIIIIIITSVVFFAIGNS